MLLEADGAPGAVGRALVTVRNLGGGGIPRPAWGSSLPGGSLVPAPADFVATGLGLGSGTGARQQTPAPEPKQSPTSAGLRGGRAPGGGRGRREEGGGGVGELPDNPPLEAFYPKGRSLHETLFYRVAGDCGRGGYGGVGVGVGVGREEEIIVPLNERVRRVL